MPPPSILISAAILMGLFLTFFFLVLGLGTKERKYFRFFLAASAATVILVLIALILEIS